MPVLGLEDPTDSTSVDYDANAAAALKKRADVILALSAISILFCWIAGGIATYNAYQAQQDAKAGNISGAEQSLKMATILMIISFSVLGVSILANIWLHFW